MGANHHFEYTKLLFGKLLSIYLLQLEPPKDRIPNTWVYDTRVILDKDWKKQWTPFTDIDRLSQIKARISNNLHRFLWDVITHTCPNFSAGLNNPPMKLRHGSIITSHILCGNMNVFIEFSSPLLLLKGHLMHYVRRCWRNRKSTQTDEWNWYPPAHLTEGY